MQIPTSTEALKQIMGMQITIRSKNGEYTSDSFLKRIVDKQYGAFPEYFGMNKNQTGPSDLATIQGTRRSGLTWVRKTQNKQPIGKIHYGGNIVDVKQPYLCEYHRIHPELPKHLPVYPTKYCSGRFYLLSREVTKDLIRRREFIEDEYLEDYAIGFHMSDSYKTTMIHLASNSFFKDFS